MRGIFILFFFIYGNIAYSQSCTTLGQTPSTAFPVCGTTVFSQSVVPICGGSSIPGPCTAANTFTDKNPFWYRFTCFGSGTLGFKITPLNLNEDYDWQIFDITGRTPNEVFSSASLFVACNWSAEFGVTGASPAGTSLVRCEGPGVPLFSSMPSLIIGHTYLMLVSHFSDSQSGYNLSFEGGTANITDPTDPHLQDATAACDGSIIGVKLNKKMKCRTLASDGSDFTLTPAVATVVSASGINCNRGFDMDSLTLVLSNPLPPGTYTLTIKKGSDANTLLDNCDRAIPEGDQIQVTVFPLAPTPMDSIAPVACAPDKVFLVFRKNIRCSSIAADGSDFSVTGSYPVTITGASATCSTDGLSKVIAVQFSQPLQTAGNFNITLRSGTDGTSIIDECGQITPVGSTLPFSVKDTVNADFTYSIRYGCTTDTVNYNHNGANGVNTWTWNFDGLRETTLQFPEIYYATFGPKTTQLIVSNGVCSDTSKITLLLDNVFTAEFAYPEFVCPRDQAVFIDKSTGNIQSWFWDFGNGITSTSAIPPPQTYAEPILNTTIQVQLTVTNNFGCSVTKQHAVLIVNNCYIAVPSAFTPNGDGRNDFLYPLNAYKAASLKFSIYNRFGQRLFYSDNWLNKWDGKFKGRQADPGTYVWMLSYIDTETNLPVFQKGTSILIR